MAIDTNSHEFQLLLRQFEMGNVVLFAGAGFSMGAKNSKGTDPPLGADLARILRKNADGATPTRTWCLYMIRHRNILDRKHSETC